MTPEQLAGLHELHERHRFDMCDITDDDPIWLGKVVGVWPDEHLVLVMGGEELVTVDPYDGRSYRLWVRYSWNEKKR